MAQQQLHGPFDVGDGARAWLAVGAQHVVVANAAQGPAVDPILPHLVEAAERAIAPAPDEGTLVVVRIELTEEGDGIAARTWAIGTTAAGTPTAARAEGIVREALDAGRLSVETLDTVHGPVTIRREQVPEGEHLRVTLGDSDVALNAFVPHGVEPPPPEWFYENRAPIEAEDAVQYLSEVGPHMAEGRPLFAFRAYYYFRRLADFSNPALAEQLERRGVRPGVAAENGLRLAKELGDAGEPDLADWVARSVVDLAREHGSKSLQIQAWRWAATANEALCNATATAECYDAALALVGDRVESLEERQTHMSAGISAVMLLGHVDFADPGSFPRLEAELDRAERHLRLARGGYERLPEEEEGAWSLSAIDLDLARIQHLRGDHDGALAALDRLLAADHWVPDEALEQTVLHYRLAALRSRPGRPALEVFLSASEQAAKAILDAADRPLPAARVVPVCTMIGDAWAFIGRHRAADDAYGLALRGQIGSAARTLRPPQPGAETGGWMAIDVLTRILVHIRRAHEPGGDGSAVGGYGLVLADHLKGRYLRRDVAAQITRDGAATALSRSFLKSIRDDLGSGRLDPRIMVADYEYTLASEGDAEAGRRLVGDAAPNGAEFNRLFELLPPKARVMSFWTHAHGTFVQLCDASHQVALAALRPSVADVKRAADYLQAYFSGRGPYGALDPGDPSRHDERFLGPLRVLEEAMTPLLDLIEHDDLVVISAHRAWHAIPIHALLLPALWKRGANPAVAYAPSFELLGRLRERSERAVPRDGVAVSTNPSEDDSAEVFQRAHDELLGGLAGAPTRETMARPSQEVLDAGTGRRLQHLLAHGEFKEGSAALASGLLLAGTRAAPTDVLSAADVLAHGAVAGHVTVQACSLGSTVPAEGDELWGFSRALLACGAESVLAPLWNIDVESSTRLATDFYGRWLGSGVPKWRAWADAQRAMAVESDEPALSHLFHWAAFQMVGI